MPGHSWLLVKCLPQCVGRVSIKEYLHFCGHIIGQIHQASAAGDRQEYCRGSLRKGMLDDVDWIVNGFYRAAEIDPSCHRQSTL